jgi:phospholipid/cholesterol/gamma-HCH transport system substrate-binding protein
MEENGYRFGVGVLVLASAMIGVLLIAFFGAVPNIWVDRYRVSFNFPSAPNVAIDTPVRKNGVLIGRVSRIDLLQGEAGVVLTMELDRKYELQKGEVPRVGSGNFITGDAVVEFMTPTEETLLARFDGSMGTPADGVLDQQERAASREIMADSYYSRGGEVQKPPGEFLSKLESNLEQKFVPMINSIEKAFTRIDELTAEGGTPIKEFVTSAKLTLDKANTTIDSINDVAIQVRDAEIPRLIANSIVVLPDLFKEAQNTLGQTQRTLKGFEQFSASLEGLGKEFEGIGETIRSAVENANVAIENIAEFTDPLSENSDRLVQGAVKAIEDLNALAVDLKRFTNKLNSSNGTVTKLIESDQMYYKVLKTVDDIQASSRNIQSLTQRMQPIIGDIRVFSDKVSRDPGRVLRDALRFRQPSGLGVK